MGRENLNLRTRLRDHAQETVTLLRALPDLIRQADAALSRVSDGGIKLHPETVTTLQAQRQRFHREWLWLGWAALILLALAHIT